VRAAARRRKETMAVKEHGACPTPRERRDFRLWQFSRRWRY
jgi:hypothetical protein